jgi:hypothetical protein
MQPLEDALDVVAGRTRFSGVVRIDDAGGTRSRRSSMNGSRREAKGKTYPRGDDFHAA